MQDNGGDGSSVGGADGAEDGEMGTREKEEQQQQLGDDLVEVFEERPPVAHFGSRGGQ